MQDLYDESILRQKVEASLEVKNQVLLKIYNRRAVETDEIMEDLLRHAERIRPLVTDTGLVLNQALDAGRTVLFEAGQATLLDVDHGTYPFVTSSSTVAGGASIGAGVGPRHLHQVIGISKAYVTRVGSGPFPTELLDEMGDQLRQAGQEFGATTGRPRRCGWFDAVAMREAVRTSGITGLAITKLDVLSDLPAIKICTAYSYKGEMLDYFPRDLDVLKDCNPVYEELEGWQSDISGIKTYEELPPRARAYLDKLSEISECPLVLISVGPRRDQTIQLSNPFVD